MENTKIRNIRKNIFKFRILMHFILIALILIISGVIIINSSAETFLGVGRKNGTNTDTNKEILYIGDNIILFKTADYCLLDPESREEKIQYELGICALYYYANNLDISVTDEQVKSKIITDRKINDYIANKEKFNIFLSSLGMSEDDYWECDRLFDMTKKTLTVEKLLRHQRKVIEQKYKDASGINIDEKLENWRLEKIEEILYADNVKRIEN